MGRVFLPQQQDNIAGEQMANANQVSASQMAQSINGGSGMAGTLGDSAAHIAALPSFITILVFSAILFYLVFHSHVSMAASVGVGK